MAPRPENSNPAFAHTPKRRRDLPAIDTQVLHAVLVEGIGVPLAEASLKSVLQFIGAHGASPYPLCAIYSQR